jgi:hypothetical protein
MMGGRRHRRSPIRSAVVAMLCVLRLMIAGWPVVAEMRRKPGPSMQPTQRAVVSRAQGGATCRGVSQAQQTWLGLYRVAQVNIEKFGTVERVYRNYTRCGPPG